MVYEGNEQLHDFYVQQVKILKGRRSNVHNRRLIVDLRGKENVVMVWRGVGKKKKNCKKNVLHPYPIPITDSTPLLEVSVFLFRVS